MTAQVPIIIDFQTQRFAELPVGTDLDVSGSNIIATNINTSGNIHSNANVTANVISANFIYGDGRYLSNIAPPVPVAGSNTQVQFNDANVVGANSSFTFDKANGRVSATQFAGDGSRLTGLRGSNVIGNVGSAVYAWTANVSNVANTALSVSVANVQNIGNIATVNLDGNVANVLTGAGTFIAVPTGGGNVDLTGLATETFVGNSINALGNIRTVNLDGNVANVLSGNGSWVQNKTAGGSNTHVQFNNNGTLGGSAKFNYDGNTMVVMSESSAVGPASFFRVSNTASGAFNAGRIRGTVANPLPVQVGDQALVAFPMLTANGAATIGGITGFAQPAATFGARVAGLPAVNGGALSQSIIFSPTSNVANAARIMMTLEYSNVSIATNAANSNVTIAGGSANSNVYIAASSANSNVYIAGANNSTVIIGGGSGSKLIMYATDVPATATSTGTTGQVAFDQNYIYYCYSTDQWKRSPLSTW
jgi:hypothetical protein